MKITVSAKNIELTSRVTEYIEDKINGLSRLVRVHDEQGAADAYVEVKKTTRHHRKGDVFCAEVHLNLPGTTLLAASEDVDIFAAIDEIKDELARQIKAYKGKRAAQFKKGMQEMKQEKLRGIL
ncbi:MAG: ribosome-associated translation inhibitor RaiA [Patescibacteria group bacterium]|nr:ribosome-associated translation inhibitor RaiA [Patescibacteria group bacterium]MDE2437781.1 ribosome-associated translation inhibitor RaiA [Patescibacteria group bacterium]